MSKNPAITITLIILLVIAGFFFQLGQAVLTIHNASKVRMLILTRNMAGGTSLVYEIDTRGMEEHEKRDLSQRMITVLRRRIDPANIQNLIWLPQGNTRFEIRISPAASPSAPQDIQRMLKGAGILEFRILPTLDHPEVDTDEIEGYVELLKSKGPKHVSGDKFVWCEIADFSKWKVLNSIVGQFGDKYYVLASNQQNELLLHINEGPRAWKLKRAFPSTDEMGRWAIGFRLDEKGGRLFSNITGKNIDRPLCILLDGMAISAPSINERIGSSGIIRGSFTQTDVEDIVNKLNAGCLPAKLIEEPISIETIGPSINHGKPDQSTENEENLSKDQ